MNEIVYKPELKVTKTYINKSNHNKPHTVGVKKHGLLIEFSIAELPQNIIIKEAILKLTNQNCKKILFDRMIYNADIKESKVSWNELSHYYLRNFESSLGEVEEYLLDIVSSIKKWHNHKDSNHGIFIQGDEKISDCYDITKYLYMYYSPVITIRYAFAENEKDPVNLCTTPCNASTTKYIHAEEIVVLNHYTKYASIQNTSLTKNVTYFIKNIGNSSVEAWIEISPNCSDFIREGSKTIAVGEIVPLVPYIYSKYTQVGIKALEESKHSKVRIWYQAQC